MARIFMMNDDYNTVIYARNENEAEEYFKSTFDDVENIDEDQTKVYREINKNEKCNFESLGEMTFDEFVKDIPDENVPTILCWQE